MTIPAAEQTTSDTFDTVPSGTTSLDAVLRPVRSGNAFEEAIQRIVQAIRLGAVTTGERLPPERTLAKRLGISRVTLREALRALTDAGLVESRRGRSGGTFITYRPDDDDGSAFGDGADARHDLHDLEDSLILRSVLEPGAAEAAAMREHDEATRSLLLERIDAVTSTTNRRGHRLADARLHLAIAELSGSVSLVAAVADVQMSVTDLLEQIPVLPHNIQRSHEQHQAVVTAILAGRPAEARHHMREHVSATAALLRGFLG